MTLPDREEHTPAPEASEMRSTEPSPFKRALRT